AVRERHVDGVLHEGLAGHAAAQAHVDDVGRGRVVRDARDVAARGPDDGVAQVGPRATHVAEHAHVLDLGAVGHAGHAEVVVGDRGHGAGHVRAVPAAVVLVVPVALVVRVRVAAVAVTRVGGIGDEVVAVDELARQVGVVHLSGVEHGNHRAGAGHAVPGLDGVDAHARALVVPLLREQRVVGLVHAIGEAVGLHRAHGRILAQGDLELLALLDVDLAVEADQLGAGAEGALDADAHAQVTGHAIEL